MSILTPFFNLIKPQKGDRYRVSDFNANFDTIDAEMHKPPLTVNGISPNPTTRDLLVSEVPLADNLTSDDTAAAFGAFVDRMSGGDASIADGNALLVYVQGNSVKSGVVPEVLTATPSNEALNVTISRETFLSQVSEATTLVFTYSGGWDTNPATYGLTVTGTPTNGDTITVVYVPGNLGQIVNAAPLSFNATGWNLYNNAVGYARVLKYSTEYGYCISGAYTSLKFAATLSGEQTAITPVDGFFNVPSDGYVFVTGGNANTTEIFATWGDWVESHPNYERYNVDTIDLSEIMVNFPFGLASVGAVRDEINFSTHTATSRIERVANTAENLATVIASGVAYDLDANYIYYVKTTPDTYAIEGDGEYIVSEHGQEFFSGTSVPCETEILYGQDLKNTLIRDTLRISAQPLENQQQAQVRTNIGAASAADVAALQTAFATSTNLSALIAWGSAYVTGDNPVGVLYGWGNVRMLRLVITPKNTNADWTTICTLPEGHRPAMYVNVTASGKSVRCTTAGVVEVYNRAVENYVINIIFIVP